MFSFVGVSAEFGTSDEFDRLVVKFTPVGAFSLVGVLAEFGTLGGMLICYSC